MSALMMGSMSGAGALFPTLVEGSLRASVVLVVALGVRWLLRRAGWARLLDLLWLAVLARLLIPVMPAVPWSGFNVVPGGSTGGALVSAPPLDRLAPSAPLVPTDAPATSAIPLRPGPATIVASSGGWARAGLLLWAAGAVVSLAFVAWGARRTRRLLRAARPLEGSMQGVQDVRTSMQLVQDRLGLRGPLRLLESDDITSPAIAGWWRPAILLPAGLLQSLSPEARVHVLLHELGHLRRQDLWVQRLFKLALALHWWNPLVWLAARLAHGDREVACDAWVLRRLARFDGRDESDPCGYGETLLALSLAARPGRWLPTGMAEDGGRLQDRVRRIAHWRRAPGWRGGLGLALAAGFAVAVLGNESPGPLRPLAFQPVSDAPAGNWVQADGVWADASSFGQARRLRVRGQYQVAGCDQAVLVAETLGGVHPEPTADRVKLVPCGTGAFELDFTMRGRDAPAGVVVTLMNARGACGLAAVALTVPGRRYGQPRKSVADVCWRNGSRVSPGYDHLSWVGQDEGLLPLLPVGPTDRRSDWKEDQRSAILFENQSTRVVFLHWMDFRGRPRLWGFLSPGESFRAWTKRNHVWTVASERGESLGAVVAEAHPGRAIIR